MQCVTHMLLGLRLALAWALPHMDWAYDRGNSLDGLSAIKINPHTYR